MKKIVKNRSEFSRNVLTLMTGTTIAQAIPIAISPILTRLYSPEDFGILALFLAIVTIFGSISTGRYELAIMLPEDEKDALNIMTLGIILTLFLALFLLFITLLFYSQIIHFLGDKSIGIWLYFVPIAVFFTGLFNILNIYNLRNKFYKDVSKAKVIKSFVLAIVPILIGYVQSGASGLILGQLLSHLSANLKLFKNIFFKRNLFSYITIKNIRIQAKKYIDYPKYSLWGILANRLSIQLVNILISSFFSVKILGYYSLVQKILGLPSALIGGSIGQVYFEQASKEKNKYGNTLNIFKKTVKKSFIIGFILFFPLYFILDDIFSFVFGKQWRVAGEYGKIILPFFYIRFIAVTVSTTFSIYNFLKIELIWQLSLLIGMVSIVYYFRSLQFTYILTYINIYGIFLYTISLLMTFIISKGEQVK